MTPRLLLTAGEPAGIGPDIVLDVLARTELPAAVIVVADPALLAERARRLGLGVAIEEVGPDGPVAAQRRGRIAVWPLALARPAIAGQLDAANAGYVLATLAQACDACLDGRADALVTAPVHKALINEAGTPFTGHTEYLAARCAAPVPVMLLVAGELRVALATTHLPLARVPAAITGERIAAVCRVLAADLGRWFGLREPRIHVCGLNPHAGDGGHLGTEDEAILRPVIAALAAEGLRVSGPLAADTAFTPAQLERCDAVLAMYHDQGLPVIKHAGFGRAVNVTLGLPIVRTSVDHGTALELAGTGKADSASLSAALELAIAMAAT